MQEGWAVERKYIARQAPLQEMLLTPPSTLLPAQRTQSGKTVPSESELKNDSEKSDSEWEDV